MAKDLNLKTVAEGVENKMQIDYLKDIGCDIVQGYYYSKPLPKDELKKYIDKFLKNYWLIVEFKSYIIYSKFNNINRIKFY